MENKSEENKNKIRPGDKKWRGVLQIKYFVDVVSIVLC